MRQLQEHACTIARFGICARRATVGKTSDDFDPILNDPVLRAALKLHDEP